MVSKDVPSNVTVAGVPAREFSKSLKLAKFKAYAVSTNEIDPREQTLNLLIEKVKTLEKKIKSIENNKNKK